MVVLVVLLLTIALLAAGGMVKGRVSPAQRDWCVRQCEWAGLLLAVGATIYGLTALDSLGVSGEPLAGNGSAAFQAELLLEREGVVGLFVLAGPIAVAGLPFLFRAPTARQRMRVASAVVLVALALVGALSVGLLHAPAALALVAAARFGHRVSGVVSATRP